MPDFWIDSNVYITSCKGILAFDLASRFWGHLDRLGYAGRISSPIEVYNELHDHFTNADPLIVWIRGRQGTHFTGTNNAVLQQQELIAGYVNNRYSEARANDFLSRADSWLIAHALTSGRRIVTNEKRANEPGPNRNTGLIDTRVKIPNVAQHFGVQIFSLQAMLRALGINDL